MSYVTIEDFRAGMDRRRKRVAGTPGSLWTLTNAHITRGGDVERRKKFVKSHELPASVTKGLFASAGSLYVFGDGATPAGIPSGITYQRLQHPSTTSAMTRLIDAENFGGDIYAVASYESGNTYNYYDGSRVTEWDGLSQIGMAVMTHKSKMYALYESIARFSALNDASKFSTGTDPGFIAMSEHEGGAEELTALEVYQGNVAFFSRRAIQVWFLDQDSSNNSFLHLIRNTGTRARHSVVNYGNNDVFYLSDSGVRSIKSRDVTDSPFVSDVGTAIDTYLRDLLPTFTDTQIERAKAIVEPSDGRYWLAIGSTLLIFTFFPSSKISAWSVYDLSEEIEGDVEDIAILSGRVYVRSGDSIYLYGGDDDDTYPDDDEAIVTVEIPFLDGGKPATLKTLTGLDAALTGTWEVEVLVDPNDESIVTETVVLNRTTYGLQHIPMSGEGSHFAAKLVCRKGGAATLSQLTLHYDEDEAA